MPRLALSTLVLLVAAGLPAQQPGRPPEPEPTLEDIQTIRRILEMPPERLGRLRHSIEKIERMSPTSRREFAANLARYESASPEERFRLMKEMRERGGPGPRVVEIHLKSLSPAAAKLERRRIEDLSPEQRLEFVRGLVEKHGPELAKERGKPGEPKDAPPKRRKDNEGDGPSPPPPGR